MKSDQVRELAAVSITMLEAKTMASEAVEIANGACIGERVCNSAVLGVRDNGRLILVLWVACDDGLYKLNEQSIYDALREYFGGGDTCDIVLQRGILSSE